MAGPPNKADTIQQLFRRLQIAEGGGATTGDSYTVLVQHSLSFRLRQEASGNTSNPPSTTKGPGTSDTKNSAVDDTIIYRRAGLRTPSENALRDLEGGRLWIEHLIRKLHNVMSDRPTIVIKTTPTEVIESLEDNHQDFCRLVVINTSDDPFGWNGEYTLNNENLEAIVDAIRDMIGGLPDPDQTNDPGAPVKLQRVPIIFQSITPILQRHGVAQTIKFLHLLSNNYAFPLIVPVLTETLSPSQHRIFEDFAEAVLYLDDGDAVLLRQGVRERGNLVRETIPFNVSVDSNTGVKTIIDGLDGSLSKYAYEDISDTPVTSANVKNKSIINSDGDDSRKGKKIVLQMEEEGDPKPNDSSGPRIFLQDDDPEFDDYDEEDPDDDLDI